MIQEARYAKPSDVIKGYKESVIAKNETNDCVVRAFASSFNIDYDQAHSFVKDTFKRENRRGTKRFVITMDQLANVSLPRLNDKSFRTVDLTELKTENKTKSATVGQFLKKYVTGSYLVVVRGHAFTIKYGVVIGNNSDATKLKKPLKAVYEVL